MRDAAVMTLGGMVLTATLLVGVGSGLFHVGRALAGPGARHADMVAAGVDPTPVGTVRRANRVERLRAQKP